MTTMTVRSLVAKTAMVLALAGCSGPADGGAPVATGGSVGLGGEGGASGGSDIGGAPGIGGSAGGDTSPDVGGAPHATGGATGGGVATGGETSSGGTGGSGGGTVDPEPVAFPVPAQLRDKGTCWWDEFPNPACKAIPDLDPPVIEWSCPFNGGTEGPTVARLRIPAGTCMRLSGVFDRSAIAEEACSVPEVCAVETHTCVTITNATAEDTFRYVHRRHACGKHWTAQWFEGECDLLCQ